MVVVLSPVRGLGAHRESFRRGDLKLVAVELKT